MDYVKAVTGNGYEFKISPEDADLLELPWTGIQVPKRTGGVYKYVVRRKRRGRGSPVIGLHRMILERVMQQPLPRWLVSDHINGDTLDNRRENLRPASVAQNRHNGVCDSNNSSGYRGVSLHQKRQSWCATIMYEGKRHFIGWFKDKHDAARAYNQKASELYGEFAKLNEVQNA